MSIASALSAIIIMITGAPAPDMVQDASKPVVEAAPKTNPELARPADAPVDAQPDEKKSSGAMKCQVEIERGPSNRTIIAMAIAAQAPQSGTYELEIQKTGANTARSRQHGDFVLGSGETKRLAKVRMSVAANEALSGRLLLNTKDGETICDIK
jgi:hypothetical protein